MSTFNISINYTNKALRSLSIKMAIIAVIGFAIWYIVDLPVRYAPTELSIPYYIDVLPNWLINIFTGTLFLALVSYILFDVRKNKRGTLIIEEDKIIIKSKNRCDQIKLTELLRISVIVLPFSIQRYRLEFIYPDFSFKRIKLKNKEQFNKVLNSIVKVAPEDFEIIESSFESMEK